MKNIILGTAGHIDHGKSALVRALTGIDPDRLKEEKMRGITIDLGFADLRYEDGLTVGIVDVPGHERLVRNMLAGAGGIDIVLLVIAADEGVMPQSREHLAICNLLGIKSGIIVVTKTDIVENDWLELVRDVVRDFVKGTFLEDAEIVPLSSKTGDNIDLLKEKIHALALKVKPKSAGGLFRLPIDRVFTLKGFGTVVTGTALSGSIHLEETVELLPEGLRSKVRGLQSHGKGIETAYAGQRVAINLQGIEKEDLRRGDVVVVPDRFRLTRAVDARIEVLRNAPTLKNKSRVHFHLATSEVIGRVVLYDRDELKGGESSFCQIRLGKPVLAVSGDRFVIRRLSPVETIGGGIILDAYAKRRRKKEGLGDLEIYQNGKLGDMIAVKIRKYGFKGISPQQLEGWLNEDTGRIRDAIKGLIDSGRVFQYNETLIHRDIFLSLKERMLDTVGRFHRSNPLKAGMSKEVLRSLFGLQQKAFQGVLSLMEELVIVKDTVRHKDFQVTVTDRFVEIREETVGLLREAGFQPPSKEELAEYFKMKPLEIEDILRLMSQEGLVQRITDSIYLRVEDYKKMLDRLRDFFGGKDSMTVGEFRDLIGTTRKYALPFLEHLDSNKITMRVGDVRKPHPSFMKK